MRKLTLTLIVVLAVSVVLFVAALPPAPETIDVPPAWRAIAARTAAGAYHVHSRRSDGAGTRDDIAAAARRAGLQFVIVTDHGDATRPTDPPIYVDGVLVLDAVEISTDGGHYVALDMPRAPYPLGGAAAAVVEDVARLGGFGVAAHPASPKPSLRWSDQGLPVDGIEWLNADSAWRDESRAMLGRAVLGYLVRPAPALAMLLDRPPTLAWWDHLSTDRPVVALAAADAHGGVGQRVEDRGGALQRVGLPSYEASFREFSNRVVLDRPLSGEPAADARAIYGAIRAGRVFSTIDAAAGPGLLDLHREGSAIVARVLGPPGTEIVLFNRGQELARTAGEPLRWETGDAGGAYRVEARVPGMPGDPPVPWLVSNEVFVGVASPRPAISEVVSLPFNGARAAALPWRIEKEASSSAIVRTTGGEVELEYQLGQDAARSPYVALAADLPPAPFSAVRVSLAADRPTRVSVQLRDGSGRRWGRSVYVSPDASTIRVPLTSMRSLDGGGAVPDPASLTSLLLVIDLTNASPLAMGQLRVLSAETLQE